MLLLFMTWIALSAGCHVSIRQYFPASFLAACASVAVLQLVNYMELGHLDPFWHISSITGFLLAGIIALLVGLPFRIARTLKDTDQ